MDPHQMHNNVNGTNPSQQASQMQQAYNQQMLLQQNYPFYQQQQQQMLGVDQNMFQQMQLQMQMQQQMQLQQLQAQQQAQQVQQQPIMQMQQQQQMQQNLQMLQQQQLLQQHQQQQGLGLSQQRFTQHNQQQQMQQRLLEEQQRMLEEQQALKEKKMREEQLRLQKIREAEEEQRRREEEQKRREAEAAMRAQLEAQMREQMRLQEEATRQAEALRIREENEARERAKLLKIQAEQERAAREAAEQAADMRRRIDAIPQPITLTACAAITKFTTLIPFPCENMTVSALPCVCPSGEREQLLAAGGGAGGTVDTDLLGRIALALAECNVDDIKLRSEAEETNDLPVAELPPLIRALLDHDNKALDVEPEHIMMEDAQLLNEVLNEGAIDNENRLAPSTSTAREQSETSASPHQYAAVKPEELRDQTNLRKQMVSVGKQPKQSGSSASNNKRKRDMVGGGAVESLYDSLTDYFDPSQGRRCRRKTKTLEEEQAEQKDLELVARMQERELEGEGADGDAAFEPLEGTSGASGDEIAEQGKFFEKKRAKKKTRDEPERPPTPNEVIAEREREWQERQRQRLEKMRRHRKGGEDDEWNNDIMAENQSFERFTQLIEQVFDNVEDLDVNTDEEQELSPEMMIDRHTLESLRSEAHKLKFWKKINKESPERLIKLLTVVERSIRDALQKEGRAPMVPIWEDEPADDEEAVFRDLLEERLLRAADAACTALIIMTSHKVPKQVLIEETIERSVLLCKQFLNYIIYPASDLYFRASNKNKVEDKRRRKVAGHNRSPLVQRLYTRMTELVKCFAELVRVQSLSETTIHQLSTMAASAFFVNNVGEMQLQAMHLLTNVFSRGDEPIRVGIMNDLLNSLHRMPSSKSTNNSYRISSDAWLNNCTVLVLQLIQSTIRMPKRKRHSKEDRAGEGQPEENPDVMVKESFRDAQRLAYLFISGFLAKLTNKEEDFRRLLDGFVADLLAVLNRPEWPAAEFVLNLLGQLFTKTYHNKQQDIGLRTASLEYIGSITARLRRDQQIGSDTERMDMVVRTLVYDEMEPEEQPDSIKEVDISELSTTEKHKKLEQALIDYLVESRGDADHTIEFAIRFYVGEWYKETAEDMDIARAEYKEMKKHDLTDKERRKLEKKQEKMLEKATAMKEFLIKLVDKKHMRKRNDAIKRIGNVMLECDAAWTVKYLASRRDFSHSFEVFLKQILHGVSRETTVSLRTKALRCLTQIIEADAKVLLNSNVHAAVQARMVDSNAQVREATIELLGKYVVNCPDVIPTYYPILLERIKDAGMSVRKRVIRIMRELCDKYPDFDKIPEMLARMMRRVNDEDGVKKLIMETFTQLWFQPVREKDTITLLNKMVQMTTMMRMCAEEKIIDQVEQLLISIVKGGDKGVLYASKQLVDCLVDNVLQLDSTIANENGSVKGGVEMTGAGLSAAAEHSHNQERMLAALTTLSLFSKVRPELMVAHAETLQPYLTSTSQKSSTPAEDQVLNQVINMLERVVPLMTRPSESFVNTLDELLAKLATAKGMVIIESAVACSAAVFNKFTQQRAAPALKPTFIEIAQTMVKIKNKYMTVNNFQLLDTWKPRLTRYAFTLGLLVRYYDWDKILTEEEASSVCFETLSVDPEAAPVADVDDDAEPERKRVRDNVFILLEFFCRSNIGMVKHRALVGLGNLCAQYAEYWTRQEIKSMYRFILQNTDESCLPLKIQGLKNLEIFLLNEEKKLVKSNEDWARAKETQDLKEMELAGSGLGSAVIQVYWANVLNCYFHADNAVRHAACQVTWLTLSQGLVTPGDSIPTLIAMTTDSQQSIRNRVENLLKEIDCKYTGMVQSKSIVGIRIAYNLQSMLARAAGQQLVRGQRAAEQSAIQVGRETNALDPTGRLPRMSSDCQALLSGLYQSLRANRQQRRSFLSAMLRLFGEDSRERLTLSEWIFVADNIAMFPYQVLDEPLYAIRQIDSIISISGQSIVNQFKSQLLPRSQPGPEDDDADFVPELIYRRLPEDKSGLISLMNTSQACFILLYLKTFLMKMYALTEQKVQEYSPSEAAKVYEKTVTRKNVHTFYPHTAILEMSPEVAAERNTLNGHFNIAHQICNFRQMLLSLDDKGEEEEEEEEEVVAEGGAEGAGEEEAEQMEDDNE